MICCWASEYCAHGLGVRADLVVRDDECTMPGFLPGCVVSDRVGIIVRVGDHQVPVDVGFAMITSIQCCRRISIFAGQSRIEFGRCTHQ